MNPNSLRFYSNPKIRYNIAFQSWKMKKKWFWEINKFEDLEVFSAHLGCKCVSGIFFQFSLWKLAHYFTMTK